LYKSFLYKPAHPYKTKEWDDPLFICVNQVCKKYNSFGLKKQIQGISTIYTYPLKSTHNFIYVLAFLELELELVLQLLSPELVLELVPQQQVSEPQALVFQPACSQR
jgi:hypothetical protein